MQTNDTDNKCEESDTDSINEDHVIDPDSEHVAEVPAPAVPFRHPVPTPRRST